MTTVLPVLGIFTLLGLLYSKRTINKQSEWILKPLTSLLFILTGIAAGVDNLYGVLVLIGLILGFLGDIYLMLEDQRWFLAGLVVFLLGHIAYVVAFNAVTPLSESHPVVIGVFVVIGVAVFWFLRPHLGNFQIPVLAYMLVITVMVLAALGIYLESNESQTFRLLVAAGAICFYLSDLGMALDRFMPSSFKHVYWSLPLYYAAQFMLALSIGQI
jgi:uncharacterized membrane protein YhhN